MYRQFRRIAQVPSAALGGVVVASFLALGLLAPWLAPLDPFAQDLGTALHPPSSAHWFGTDELGRDLASRVIVAARVDLSVVVLGIAAATVLATPAGLIAGYFRGPADRIATAVSDLLLTFPSLVLAVVLVSLLGSGISSVVVAVALTTAPPLYRLVRGLVLQIALLDYIDAARAVGATHFRIISRHILPNLLGRTVVYTTLLGSHAILTVTALGFLGLGVQPPTPEWGNMLVTGRTYLGTAPWLTAFPGFMIILFILGLNLFGDALRDLLDPKLLWRP